MAPIKSNNPYASYFDFFSRSGSDAVNEASVGQGLSASGGVISDYEVSGTYYRAHIFTSSGTFDVTELGTLGDNLEYLVVAGGGGGGGSNAQSGGGGAGGFRTNLTGHPVKAADYTAEVGTYTVTVGAGGLGGNGPVGPGAQCGLQGGNSEFFPTPVSYPSTKRVRSVGGGGGMGYNGSSVPQMNGGSGGGATCSPTAYAGGTGNTADPNHPQVQGYAGGAGTPAYGSPFAGGGGGGAGGAGAPDNPGDAPYPAADERSGGGYGLQCLIAGSPDNPQPIGSPGPGSGAAATGYFAGGGGGGSYGAGGAAGGYGGGADGGGNNIPSNNGPHAAASTGGGGGGSGYVTAYGHGGNGGSGVVVVRYQIGTTSTAKASGGSISFYGNKTIHAFTTSGNFVAPATFNETVEYVVVGGGGAGGGPSAPGVNSYYGGGGGAGAYRKGSTPISTPQTIAIQVGAGGAKGTLVPAAGSPSYFGSPITSPGGGYGATWQDPGGQPTVGGGPGASSGGSSYGGSVASNTGTSFTASPKDATADTPTNGWGHGGGAGYPSGDNGGGGGAGGAGQAAVDSAAGDGGLGMQLPTTFRDPAQSFGAPGPTNTSTHNPGWSNIDDSGKYWVAGGGGGGAYGPDSGHTSGVGGVGSPPVGSSPFAGAGNGSRFFAGGTAALQNTGSGGGGMERAPGGPAPQPDAGNGGSGLVLIAYPT